MNMAQLVPLPLTVSCSSKIQIGFTFLVPALPGSPGQRAVKRVCVCVISQVIGCEDHLRNVYCVEWGVKLYSSQLQPSLVECFQFSITLYCFVVSKLAWKFAAGIGQ